jgi:hypothetical protein
MLSILPVRRVGRRSPAGFPAASAGPLHSLLESSPVPAPCARQIIVTTAERRRLEKLAHSRTAGYQQVIRARIVLDAARGYSNAVRVADLRRGICIVNLRSAESPVCPFRWPQSGHS